MERAGGLGTRLANNFTAFDFWDFPTKTATSAKTLNMLAPTYREQPSAVYGRLKLYLDAMADFETDRKNGARIFANQILTSRLILAVPESISDNQIVQVLRARDYANQLGIDFVVTLVEQP